MIHIWRFFLDFWFPPSDSMLILRALSMQSPLLYYKPTYPHDILALASYTEPYIKASITAGKFEHNEAALKRLGVLLHHHLKITDRWLATDTIFVPIPLHPKRERERGYNQVTILLQAALKNSDYRISPLLRRTIHTSPQSHLTRAERLTHLKEVFAFEPRIIDWNSLKQVVIVDDVATTGSTLTAAVAALRPHVPKHIRIERLAFAH